LSRAASGNALRKVGDLEKVIGIPRPALRSLIPLRFLFLVWLGVSTVSACSAASSLVQKAAPEFVRSDLNHRRVDLRAYRGKIVLLNFWATWCAPCQLEMPRFIAWQNKYGPRGLRIIGISMDDDPAMAGSLVRKLKLNYPVVMGDEKIGHLYGGVMGLPITFLIDKQGRVQAQYQGETDLNSIEEEFKLLLGP